MRALLFRAVKKDLRRYYYDRERSKNKSSRGS